MGFNCDRNLRYICKQSNQHITAIGDFVQIYKIYTPGGIGAHKPGLMEENTQVAALRFGKNPAG
ncbi:MAG: hypothetical protein P2A85_19425 [Microcoleus anatoxicus]|uniref:hypothetical protein n=1 Tax=Microcoleus anatoxicus TaxID=2705319 RepID=UPI00366E5FD4